MSISLLPHASLHPHSVLSILFRETAGCGGTTPPGGEGPGDSAGARDLAGSRPGPGDSAGARDLAGSRPRPPPARSLLLALDVDGTLAPIVANPGDAAVPPSTLRTLWALAQLEGVHTLIISGRKRETLSAMLGPALLSHVSCASSHGFVISSKFGKKVVAEELLPSLAVAHAALRAWVAGGPAGVALEDNASCLSVHYRNLHSPNAERKKQVEAAVDEVVAASEGLLEKRSGKEVWELRPRVSWDKGKALQWLVEKSAHGAAPAPRPRPRMR